MRTKLGTTFLVAMFALAGIGISYAGFTDEIYIYGEAETATVKLCIEDFSSTEIWKVLGTGAPADEIFREHWYPTIPFDDPFGANFDGLLTEDDAIEDGGTDAAFVAGAYAYPYLQDKDGTTSPQPPVCEKTVYVDFVNMFPCQDFTVDFVVSYEGTIPVKLLDFVVDTYALDETELPDFKDTNMNWLEYLWWLGMDGQNVKEYPNDPMKDTYGIFVYGNRTVSDGNGGWSDTSEVVGPGYQIHPGEFIHIYINIHVPQDNDFQGLTGLFSTTLTVKQWNEVDGNGNEITPS